MGLAQLLAILKTQKLDLCTGLAQLMFLSQFVDCSGSTVVQPGMLNTTSTEKIFVFNEPSVFSTKSFQNSHSHHPPTKTMSNQLSTLQFFLLQSFAFRPHVSIFQRLMNINSKENLYSMRERIIHKSVLCRRIARKKLTYCPNYTERSLSIRFRGPIHSRRWSWFCGTN